MDFKSILLTLISLSIGGISNAQGLYEWQVGIENHFQFNRSTLKNIDPASSIQNLPQQSFSGTEGVGFQLGFTRKVDSSRVLLHASLQHIFGNLISMGSLRDSNLQKEELLQTRQTHFKLGSGFQFKNFKLFAGPLLPLLTKSASRFYLEDNTNKYYAVYDISFKPSIGLWFAFDYSINVQDKAVVFLGLGGQFLDRSIDKKSFKDLTILEGNQTLDNFAPNTYEKESIFLNEVNGNINNNVVNPSGVDFNRPRELQSQSYSFSSWYIQFGLRWKL